MNVKGRERKSERKKEGEKEINVAAIKANLICLLFTFLIRLFFSFL